MSVPLGQLALEARHLPGIRGVNINVLGHLIRRLLPFLARPDGGVNTGDVESEKIGFNKRVLLLLNSWMYFNPGFVTLFLGGGGELLVDAAILLFSFFFLRADLSEVSEILRKKVLK